LVADEAGSFSGQCAEYCGLEHANMRLTVIADEEDDFQAWVQEAGGGSNEPEEASPEAEETASPEALETASPVAEETASPEAEETASPEAEETASPVAEETASPEAEETPEATEGEGG
jgi:heme/copper-type cytochrome/quinol oxidase subunit 2